MRLGLITIITAVLAFAAGAHVRNVEAGSISGGVTFSTGSGGAVGASGPIALTGPVSITGDVSCTGNETIGGTLGVVGAVSITGALGVTGAATLNGGATIGKSSGDALTVSATSAGSAVVANGVNSVTSYGLVVNANGSSGRGIQLNATGGGYPMVVNPDTTSPATPHVSWTPQSVPSASSDGDMTVATGSVMRLHAGASGRWAAARFGCTRETAAAAGSTQADATALSATSDCHSVTGADGTKGVTLPQTATGGSFYCHSIMSQVVGSNLKVYGHNSDNDTINGGAADAVYVQLGGTTIDYCTTNGTDWTTY